VKIGVAIGTYGDVDEWTAGATRAMDSALGQATQVAWIHGDSLMDARNSAAVSMSDMDHLIFLDADDELSPGYVDAMRDAYKGDALYRPATIGVYADGSTDEAPVMIPRTDMRKANCAVIGTMINAERFNAVGGFRDLPILEDWDLWQRAMIHGAVLHEVRSAVYRVNVRPGSRNAGSNHGRVYSQIRSELTRPWSGVSNH